MRIARTVTGRSLVVAFTGAYHGINDEALVVVLKLQTLPCICRNYARSSSNMLILEYGTDESLQIIRER
jgi:glutamate-1-semialdehyde aminotransferase